MRITAQLLQRKGACRSQVDLFRKLFPRGRVVTEKLCRKYAQRFQWGWAGANLLPKRLQQDWYDRTAPIRNEYEIAMYYIVTRGSYMTPAEKRKAHQRYLRKLAVAFAEFARRVK